MANTHSTLTGLFTDIADSIRAKTGGTGAIVADKFPEAISGITTGPEEYFAFETKEAKLPQSKDWRSIAYGAGKFVSLGTSSDVALYSTDGANWTETKLPVSANWYDVIYVGGKFVAVNIDSSKMGAYSTDGVNWVASPGAAFSGRGIAYGAGKFVAVDGSACAYSTDGINWTASTAGRGYAVAYGAGKFVAVKSSTGFVYYSSDGVTWSTVNCMPSASASWGNIIYADGKFIALAGYSTMGAYSTDGLTWTAITLPVSAGWKKVAYGNGKFVAVAEGSANALYSTDGINWVKTSMPSSGNWRTVVYGAGKFVAPMATKDVVAISHDGITWSTSTITGLVDAEGNDASGTVLGALKHTGIQTFEAEMNFNYSNSYSQPIPIEIGFEPDIFSLARKYPSSGYWNYGGFDTLSQFWGGNTMNAFDSGLGMSFTRTRTGVIIQASGNYANTRIDGAYIVRAIKYT